MISINQFISEQITNINISMFIEDIEYNKVQLKKSEWF